MQFNEITGADDIAIVQILTVSADSYIRLPFDRLWKMKLVHLISGLDENKLVWLQKGAISTEITGYTEWVSETTPTISIGWDWMIQEEGLYKRISEPRSNLMLIDSRQQDFGPVKTIALIEVVIDEMAWQKVIQHYISKRYLY